VTRSEESLISIGSIALVSQSKLNGVSWVVD